MSQVLDENIEKMSDKDRELLALRHTTEHVLHAAMQNLYPELKKAMGPATFEGFYFDFDLDKKVSEVDFPKIEKEMQKLIAANLPMKQVYLSADKAREIFANNPYKLEWVEDIVKRGERISVYEMGDIDLDLCSGPHVASTGEIKAFKLLSVAGAYWHGDEKNKMLTRIYGTCFPSKPELDRYLQQLEEAKKHDHRKLGRELELFTVSKEVGPGLILWLPKGNIIKEEIEKWAKQTETRWGYQRVTTPNITKAGLYYTSGHLPYYKDDMYPPMKLDDGEEYYLKPMNCPHHHLIYAAKPRSYRELPLRLTEYGTCYRYEAAGELFGLMRVRGLTQNDAHIYCTPDQAVDEFVNVMKLHEYYFQQLGITEYHLELALRDPKNTEKYHGDGKMWRLAEKLMREAVSKLNIRMVEQLGNAAFYGPKIDFIIRSSIGREFGISTNQIDLYMGNRFGLRYTDKDGEEKTPVIIHRAPLGSHERFIGFLIEHYAGAFPLWLAPVQLVVIPIAERHNEKAGEVVNFFKRYDIRVELDNRNESMQAKIRDHALQKVPYMGIIGDKEASHGTLSVRTRKGEDLKTMLLGDFLKRLKHEIETKV